MLSVQYQRIELPMGGLMALKKMRVYFAHLQRDEQKIDGRLLTGVSELLLRAFFLNFHVCLKGIRGDLKSLMKLTFFFIFTFFLYCFFVLISISSPTMAAEVLLPILKSVRFTLPYTLKPAIAFLANGSSPFPFKSTFKTSGLVTPCRVRAPFSV